MDADLSTLRVIGARVFVHIERHMKKLASNAFENGFAATAPSQPWRVYTPPARTVVESRNIVFIEPPPRGLQLTPNSYCDTSDNGLHDVRDLLARFDLSSLDLGDGSPGAPPTPRGRAGLNFGAYVAGTEVLAV